MVKEVKESMMVEISAAMSIKDRYYEEAAREAAKKSSKLFDMLVDRLRAKIDVLTEEEIIALSMEICEMDNDLIEKHMIMFMIGMKLSESDDIKRKTVGAMTIQAALCALQRLDGVEKDEDSN